MSIPKKYFIYPFMIAFALMFFWAFGAQAEERSPMHTSGDRTFYDRDLNRVELIGHATVHQKGESLYADRITLEMDTKVVHAIGNATFVSAGAMIQAAEMHFNLETRTGTIVDGRVSTPTFTLTGERINKLGLNRFQTHRGEYSTCKDCPQSWSFAADDVDLEIDGYAYLSSVTVKLSDAPALWIPYLIIPIKTRRQSGLLMPKLGFATRGFTYVQPFFWAINQSSDMTLGFGTFGGRGRRMEWEGRYALNDGEGQANLWHLNDRAFRDYLGKENLLYRPGFSSMRYAVSVAQHQTFPFNIDQKLRITEVSDSLYKSQVGDVGSDGEAFLTSDLSFTHTTDKVSTFVAARRYRNLLTVTEPTPVDPREFDRSTVQVLPQAVMTANDKVFFDGAVAGGMSVGVMNFTRADGPFDLDQTPNQPARPTGLQYLPGRDPLREATRINVIPRLYTTMRAWDRVSIVPSLQYKNYFYSFHEAAPSLSRGYLQLQTDISTHIERVFLTSDPEFPKTKHWIKPKLTYSLIPYRREPDHPFFRQIQFAQTNGFSGYNFDNEDITPIDASSSTSNYFPPVGHALAYGFTTQWVRKRAPKTIEDAPSYQTTVEWSAAQTFNFREYRKPGDQRKQPFSRFVSTLSVGLDRFSGYVDYYYTPYQQMDENTSRHVYSTGISYMLDKDIHQRILNFERSFALSYAYNKSSLQSQTQSISAKTTYSISDFVMPSVRATYDMLNSRIYELYTALSFQSPSECWKLDLGYSQTLCPVTERAGDSRLCPNFQFNLSMNLTGSGFGSLAGEPTAK